MGVGNLINRSIVLEVVSGLTTNDLTISGAPNCTRGTQIVGTRETVLACVHTTNRANGSVRKQACDPSPGL